MAKRKVTTEQLAENMIRDLGQMSGSEKTEVRKHLDQAFNREEMLKELPVDHVLRKLYRERMLPTVHNYLLLNYMGEVQSLDQVGEEDRAEIDQLIEDGYLVNTASQQVN